MLNNFDKCLIIHGCPPNETQHISLTKLLFSHQTTFQSLEMYRLSLKPRIIKLENKRISGIIGRNTKVS